MNKALKTIIIVMLSKRYIGNKHTPENKFLNSKIKWLQANEIKEFKEQYKKVINAKIILRVKKKTEKGSNWHISLNPRKLKELYGIIEE
ncbi:MAG: hypothetical protein KKF52_03295 [Nanoarchaeota archaeon]|nr:hypothetical protein [Nanoarchaeota archaeon]MBU4352616.1 hypothetical protein [Nanoarchaeota archaeon]